MLELEPELMTPKAKLDLPVGREPWTLMGLVPLVQFPIFIVSVVNSFGWNCGDVQFPEENSGTY